MPDPVDIPPDQFVTLDGVRFHYLDWGGDGDPLLLLAGLGCTAHVYVELAPQLTDRFRVTVSSEEVPRGKPAPDVYLAAATKLAAEPAACVAVEDSANGLRAAAAAAMVVVAVSNPHFPPPADVLALARATVPTPAELTPELIRAL